MSSSDGMGHHAKRFFYRRYKTARRFFSTRPPDRFSRMFYWARERLLTLTTARKLSRLDLLERTIWKAIYFQRFGTAAIYSIETDQPVAVESADHKWPYGTIFNNSTNRNFNLKLYDHFKNRTDIRVLDLGCSGGAFVKSILEDGFTAIGVEGSDWSRKLRSGEWDTCPHHLLTSDITKSVSNSHERRRADDISLHHRVGGAGAYSNANAACTNRQYHPASCTRGNICCFGRYGSGQQSSDGGGLSCDTAT